MKDDPYRWPPCEECGKPGSNAPYDWAHEEDDLTWCCFTCEPVKFLCGACMKGHEHKGVLRRAQ